MFERRSPVALGLATCMLAGGLPPTLASAADAGFAGTPSVRYDHGTVGVVVRFDRAPQQLSRVELFTAPSLRRGERIERAHGGNTLGTVGRRANHCYVAEAGRPEPRSALRDGARWEVGLSDAAKRITETTRVTLRHERGSGWVSEAARRLGCFDADR